MTDNELIIFSDKQQKIATELIRETSIENILSEMGTIVYLGGYRLNVMFRNDVDLILVVSQSLFEETFEKFKTIFEENVKFTSVIAKHFSVSDPVPYLEWEKLTNKFELHTNASDGTPWKFDLWVTALSTLEPIKTTDYFDSMLQEHPEKRLAILQAKDNAFDGTRYRENIYAADIYSSILGSPNRLN